MADTKRLLELSEQDAPAEIKAIYDQIKACCRVPMVALIYRHLATHDGLLEWSWRALAPAMRSGALREAAEELGSVPLAAELPLLTREAGELLALKSIDRAAIAYILTSYNTANPHNIIAVRGLISLLSSDEPVGQSDGDSSTPLPLAMFPALPLRAELPPLVQLEEMSPALAERVVSLRVSSDHGSRGIVPTLYRHLAHWPEYLMDQAEVLVPLFQGGHIEATATRIAAAAETAATQLAPELVAHDLPVGRPTGAAREQLLTTLIAFAATISEMITGGRLMVGALPQD